MNAPNPVAFIADHFAKVAPQTIPSQTKAQLKASIAVDAVENFAREIAVTSNNTGELRDARARLPLVREMLTRIADILGDELGARPQLVAYAGQMVDAIDWDLRERLVEEYANEEK